MAPVPLPRSVSAACSGGRLSELSRREFVRALLAAGLLAPPGRARLFATDDHQVVSVFHTTDLHGNILPAASYEGVPDLGGFARCAAQIRRWRAENPASLYLDCGDVYQGTDAGLRTRGRVMIDLFNALGCDAWAPGNHEFDWGFEPFAEAAERSEMPLLCANVKFEGLTPAQYAARPGAGPMRKVAPWVIRERAGFKIGIVGATTTGMSAWLRPEMLGIFSVTDPVEPVTAAVRACRGEGADAVILAVHMGLRERGDDHANRVETLAAALSGQADLILAGHTHKAHESARVAGVPYTQANYFGIHCGRADLVFDRASRRLVDVRPSLALMDSAVTPDPAALSLASGVLAESAAAMAARVCEFKAPVSVESAPGRPSAVEELIAAAVSSALAERGVKADGVLHGLFNDKTPIPAGPASVADMWKVIPYENCAVTAELLPAEILAVMNEIFEGVQKRNLMGFEFDLRPLAGGRPGAFSATGVRLKGGAPLDPARRYTIAMNSYDGQSGGRRLNRLAALVADPSTRAVLHPVQTREALISYLSKRGTV